jgi:hypothetical protein
MVMSFIIQKRKAKKEQGGTLEREPTVAFSETGKPPHGGPWLVLMKLRGTKPPGRGFMMVHFTRASGQAMIGPDAEV